MNMVLKSAAMAALLGVVALASATPGEARYGRAAAAGAGFVAGAAVGAAAANSAYGSGYYAPGYGYGPGYDAYASTGSAYATPRNYYGYTGGTVYDSCGTEGNYGQSVDRSACNQ
jgi:hypothetical protein